MESAKMILAEPVLPPALLGNVNQVGDISEQKRKQAAKDFESVLLGKLLDEMKNSIGDWGFEESAASKQTVGYFGYTWPVILETTAAWECGKIYTGH